MLSACSNYLRERFAVLGIAIRYTYEQETAYFANNWASALSTTMYTLAYIVFINVVYANVPQVAGYSRDDMLFYTLVNQVNFFSLFSWSQNNLADLITDVNRGDLDLVLTKPLPHLFYITFRRVSIIQLFKDAIIPIIALIYVINWHQLMLTPQSIAIGVVILICGQIAFHTIQLLLAVPVFWKGEAQSLFTLSYILFNSNIPYEGYPSGLRIFLTIFLPILISTALTVSVMLNKIDPWMALVVSLVIATFASLLRTWIWNLALRNYTSASS